VRTQPLSYRGPNVPRYKENTTIHSTWWSRTDIPLIPAQEPWRHWGVWGVLGTELHLVPPPSLPFFLLWKTHWSRPNLASTALHCQHQTETCTRGCTTPPKTKVVADIPHYNRWPYWYKSTKITCLRPVMYCWGRVARHASTHTRHLLMPHRLIPQVNSTTSRAVAIHTGVDTRQLMKTGHCWQHHPAHSEPSQAHFFFGFIPYVPLPHGIQLFCLTLSTCLILSSH